MSLATTLEMLQEKLMQTLSRDRDARVSQLGAISSALASNGRIALKIHVCKTAPYRPKGMQRPNSVREASTCVVTRSSPASKTEMSDDEAFAREAHRRH
jgi:hypothetical protein